MEAIPLQCSHCNTLNLISRCKKCGKAFVITNDHIIGKERSLEAISVEEIPENLEIMECDFCQQKSMGKLAGAISAGLRQRTCPRCKTEFLSNYGF